MTTSTNTEGVRNMLSLPEQLECADSDPLGALRQRALRLSRQLGSGVSDVLTDIFLQAHADGKLEEVFSVLEGYCETHTPPGNGAPGEPELNEAQTRVTLALVIQEVLAIPDSVHTLRFLPRGHRYLSAS